MKDKIYFEIAGGMENFGQAHQCGRQLLKKMIRSHYGIDIEKEEDAIAVREGGKPFLKNHSGIFYNISHSGQYVVCVTGNVEIGVDIQLKKEAAYTKIGYKILSHTEYGQLENSLKISEESARNTFYFFWTKKESYVKYTGEGIRTDLKKLDYHGCRFLTIEGFPEYAITICVPETWNGEITRQGAVTRI